MRSFTLPRPTARRTLNIAYQSAYEYLRDPPEPLPLTEPATGQVVWTVAANDLPVFSFNVLSRMWVGLLYVAGKNNDATSRTVYWRMKKNGGSVSSGNFAVAANDFWTLNSFFQGIVAGDVLEVAVWATATLVTWDYEAHQAQVSRIFVSKGKEFLAPCIYGVTSAPALTLGTPNPSGSANWGLYLDASTSRRLNMYESVSFSGFVPESTLYGIFRLTYGDSDTPNGAQSRTSTTYRPLYIRNYALTSFTFRNLGVVT